MSCKVPPVTVHHADEDHREEDESSNDSCCDESLTKLARCVPINHCERCTSANLQLQIALDGKAYECIVKDFVFEVHVALEAAIARVDAASATEEDQKES